MLKFWAGVSMALAVASPAPAATGKVVDTEIQSRVLEGNLVGVQARRRIKVYLPASYERGSTRYPVIYYVHNYHWSPGQTFEENRVHEFVERAVQRGQLGEIILVAGDFTTPTGFNFFGNDRVAGRWIDHIVDELVPHIDARFRTRAVAASRGLGGDFFGGYASLKTAMLRPGIFGAVYALHPVGSGTGVYPGYARPDWKVVHEARTWQDLGRDTYAPVYVAMAQAYLPNPARPPFYCDFLVEPKDGKLEPHARNIATLQTRFHLDSLLIEHADALKQLRGLKFDWGRYDPTYGHVFANRALTLKLDGYGVAHAAEEYSGNHWDRLWTPQGRFAAELLPFFAEFLEGAEPPAARVSVAGGAR